MITIVTGGIHDGKTTCIRKIYKKNSGDGFISIKHMVGDYVSGFYYHQLSNGQEGPLATKKIISPVRDILGPYHFNEKAMLHIEESMKLMVTNKVSPIYLDEIGQLELKDKGFCKLLTWIIEHMTDETQLYITVRQSFVLEVIEKFRIEDPKVIKVCKEVETCMT